MKSYYNTLIVGTGCAGYNAADRLYELGVTDIAIITEGRTMGTSRNTGSDKQTYYKLSLAGEDGDSVREMAQTLYSGGGVMGEHALCEAAYSVRSFMRLVELGVPFPTNGYGEYVGYKTDHDPRSRATSTGPLTSRHMTEALERSVMKKGIEIIDWMRVIKILIDGGRVTGLAASDVNTGEVALIAASHVILATGGPAGVYKSVVYPESQRGATGLAIDAGARLSNMQEWQYGIASTSFRWNLSGSYQQVVPRYVSVDEAGEEREFLFDALGTDSLGEIFRKGYQWPFDTRRLGGSSRVDILVSKEIKAGRRVYLDYTQNPRGLDASLTALPPDAYEYLRASDALLPRPIERLKRMNAGAYRLYLDHGIDLVRDRLPIGICAQHANGGILVDGDWQTDIDGLYAVGEAAGTFGIYRPGGSALNSTQVGSLRAAEHIAARHTAVPPAAPTFALPEIRYGEENVTGILSEIREGMTRVADFDRNTEGMRTLLLRVCALVDDFFNTAVIEDRREISSLYSLYDTLLTVRGTLSAMLTSAQVQGTHGAAIVDGMPPRASTSQNLRVITDGARSYTEPVSPMPSPELWFERVLAEQSRVQER